MLPQDSFHFFRDHTGLDKVEQKWLSGRMGRVLQALGVHDHYLRQILVGGRDIYTARPREAYFERIGEKPSAEEARFFAEIAALRQAGAAAKADPTMEFK